VRAGSPITDLARPIRHAPQLARAFPPGSHISRRRD